MANKAKYLVSTLAALILAAPVLAAQDPAPPTNLQSEDQIIAWAKAARLTDDTANPPASWNILGALDEGLLWGSTKAPDAQGIAKVGVRLERFRPAAGVRSEAEMFDLNCQTQQIRGTFNATYPEHNFSGAKTDRAVNATWAPVASNEIVSAIKDDACKAGAASSTAAAGAVNINDPNAILAWRTSAGIRDRNVGSNPAQWSILGATNEGMVMSQLGRRDNATRTAFMIVRVERFSPFSNDKFQGSNSETREFEINCQQLRIRQTGTTWYSDHNLTGRSNGQAKLDEWIKVADHPMLGKAGADLCREFQPSRRFTTGR
jgi:hypothetical protein